MDGTSTKPPVLPAFPKTEVVEALKRWWAEETGSHSKLPDPFAKGKGDGGTVFDVQPAVDSLRAVTVLLKLEEIVPFELKEDLIQLGGYDSLNEMIGDLIPRLEDKWNKYRSLSDKPRVVRYPGAEAELKF